MNAVVNLTFRENKTGTVLFRLFCFMNTEHFAIYSHNYVMFKTI